MPSDLEKPTEELAWDRAARPSEPGFSLLVVRDDHVDTHALPVEGSVLIGRSASAEIRVEDSSVSREHARLHLGHRLQIEDLGSANGTRVRDQPLAPNERVALFPQDVIDLGAVLLVVQPRRLTQQKRRTTSLAFLQVVVEQACERGERFAVANLTVDGKLSAAAIQQLLAAQLRPSDLVAISAPGQFQLFLPALDPQSAAPFLETIVARLAERELVARFTLEAPAKAKPHRPVRAGVIAEDEAMLRVYRLAERVADSDLSALILGETGAGKEVIAELLHQLSPRSRKPLVKLNCAAMAESLIDSELFGYQKGAFTGAVTDKVGLLESASSGTVFLDEIGDMPMNTQVRLLRVLEAKEVMPLGSVRPRPIDVRVVSATHHDLGEAVTAGRFRQDLFYRLEGISIIVPPLRERPSDIAPLARHFLERAWKSPGPAPKISPEALAFLQRHAWPGNVRELKNVIERAAVLSGGGPIERAHLLITGGSERALSPAASAAVPTKSTGLRGQVKELEKERILAALEATGGSQRKAAVELGLSRGALIRRMQQLGIATKKT